MKYILSELQGQLGNQMFQYAAARIQADRVNAAILCVLKHGSRARYFSNFLGLKSCELFEAFPHLKGHINSRSISLLLAIWPDYVARCFHQNFLMFNPKRRTLDNSEVYDSDIWTIEPGTFLRGFFQSDKYWNGRHEDVRRWFSPTANVSRRVSALMDSLPYPQERMVAVHVRIGDYAAISGRYANSKCGWVLDRDYYVSALNRLPRDLEIALFSDQPDEAEAFLPRRVAWRSKEQPAVVDLFLMSRFRNLVIANSTYSWWSAMLNQDRQKVIIAPEFHIGRNAQQWYPADIAVNGWHYI